MTSKRRMLAKPGNPKTAPEPARDPEAAQILAALARIDDPMTRYLITMLVDRLTEQIARLQTSRRSPAARVRRARLKMN